MKINRIISLLLLACAFNFAHAQDLVLESAKELTMDLSASTSSRKDAHDNYCALLKISILSTGQYTFPISVGDVAKTKGGEYLVYVPAGVNSLEIKRGSETVCIVDFNSFGMEISTKTTYQIILMEEETGEAVFIVDPDDCEVRIMSEGKTYISRAVNGCATASLPVGHKYTYSINADYAKPVSGSFSIDHKDDVVTIKQSLEIMRKDYFITTNRVKKAKLWVDGTSFGTVKNGSSYSFPMGKHTFTASSKGYFDAEFDKTLDANARNINLDFKALTKDALTKTIRMRSEWLFGYGMDLDMDGVDYLTVAYVLESYKGRIFSSRTGLELDYYSDDEILIDFSFAPCLNIPLDKFNRYYLNFMFGVMAGLSCEEDPEFDYGFKSGAFLVLNHLILGAEARYHSYMEYPGINFTIGFRI